MGKYEAVCKTAAKALLDNPSDVYLFQECYTKKDPNFCDLTKELKESKDFDFIGKDKGCSIFINNKKFQNITVVNPSDSKKYPNRKFAYTVAKATEISTKKTFVFASVHTAGFELFDPNWENLADKKDNEDFQQWKYRMDNYSPEQLGTDTGNNECKEVVDFLNTIEADEFVIGGDFNCAPVHDKGRFTHLENNGYEGHYTDSDNPTNVNYHPFFHNDYHFRPLDHFFTKSAQKTVSSIFSRITAFFYAPAQESKYTYSDTEVKYGGGKAWAPKAEAPNMQVDPDCQASDHARIQITASYHKEQEAYVRWGNIALFACSILALGAAVYLGKSGKLPSLPKI